MKDLNATTTISNVRTTIDLIRATIKLIRPHHYVKNVFLFVPLFFAGEFFNIAKAMDIFFGFIAFSLVASSIYVINDYKDIEADRLHPEKSKRPLASGAISKPFGLFIFFALFVIGIGSGYFLDAKFLFILCLYFVLNIGYTFGLKHIPILDVFLVALGFVLRVRAGGALGDVHVSEWLTIMIFLLALFMAFAKRRDDLVLQKDTKVALRKSVKGYNLEFLTASMTLITAISLVAYLMYCVSPMVMEQFKTHRLYHTFWFVLAGVLRYFQIIYVQNDSGSPTKLLYKDYFLHGCIALWALSFFFIIYFPEFNLFN